LESKKIVAGLAGCRSGSALSGAGEARLCAALSEFKAILASSEVDAVYAFATASLRFASNSSEVIARTAAKTGFQLELLSGTEEARLRFIGARHSTGIKEGLVADIGGASCELVRVGQSLVLEAYSLPIGCLTLAAADVDGIFPTRQTERQARVLIREQLLEAASLFARPSATLCFVGGSARGVYRSARELRHQQGQALTPAEVKAIVAGLREHDAAVLQAVRFAAPERVFTLAAGALMMDEIIAAAQTEELLVSKCGVREGYLLDRVIGARK
jgi:exopolyphosphatase/guanosine-5'-triphosphate,3'-diphosphate pyrophosphatase